MGCVAADLEWLILPFDGKGTGRHEAVRQGLAALGHDPSGFVLYHTPWRQPRLRHRHRSGDPAPLVSFSHDGLWRLAAFADARDACGLGVDVLRLERLMRVASSPDRFRRFIDRVIGPNQGRISFEAYDDPWQRAHMLALEFCAREAVAKALGTGLCLGLGMGAGYGVRMPEIVLCGSMDCPDVELRGSALRRLRDLRASGVRVTFLQEQEAVIAVAILSRRHRRNHPTGSDVVRV